MVRAEPPMAQYPNRRGFQAVDDSGRVRGAVAFDSWRPSSAEVHIACDSAIALRRLLPVAIRFAFKDLKLAAVLAHVEGRGKALGLAERIGFRRAHVVRDGWGPDNDLHIYELRPEWCRFGKADTWATQHPR